MLKILLSFILSSTFLFGFSQQQYKTTYEQLKAFEGKYEYLDHTTLEIAASPKDTILYAIIHQSKYALTPVAKDVFLNASKEEIQFFRDPSNATAGYLFNDDSFRLLTKKVFFPESMWYPRLKSAKNFKYKYEIPQDLHDGLKTGSVENSGLDTALLAVMMHKILDGTYPNVHSVLIIKDGNLVFEEYFYEYTRDSLQELRSASKSFVSALAGIAIHKGFISKNDKVLPYFPEYKVDNMVETKNQITIEQLLTQQTGLDCDISNERSDGNETAMDHSDDWIKFTLDLPMIDIPGGKGMYCSGNPIILGAIIEKATKQPLPVFAEKTLFAPLDIVHFKWNFKPDKSNAEDFCQLYLSARDMAKFGLMYLDHGRWKGRQIVPAEWVQESFGKHSMIQGVDYGYLWWLKTLDANGVTYYGKAAQGNGGQKIYIWTEQNMVTVITGGNYNSQSPSNELISNYILPAFNKH
jgi:CubicO group peptidase (beta-lactamase class C family)